MVTMQELLNIFITCLQSEPKDSTQDFQLSTSQVSMVLLCLLSVSQLALRPASVNNHLNNKQRNVGASAGKTVPGYFNDAVNGACATLC